MELSGVVFAHGNSTTMPSSLFAATPGEPRATDAPHVEEPFATEYRALFREFVKLRRTCGETTEDLDRDRFVEVLFQKRAALIAQHAATEVKFRLAFDNGRAAVRFKTGT